MAVQPYPYLVMTDGTDTATFADGLGGVTNYPPIRGAWAPAIPALRTNQLGGRGPYADIPEDLSCNIRDTTAELCYSRLLTLARLLDKAERWWRRGERIAPVILKYAPQGSTIHSNSSPMQAIVLGRVSDDPVSGVALPADANDAGMLFEIRGVRIACLRRGAWTGASNAPAASAAGGNPTVQTIAFSASHPTRSVARVELLGFDVSATPTISAGYVLCGSNVNDIQLLAAQGMTATGFTAVSDAANLPPLGGGNVLRYTPSGTALATSGAVTFTSMSDRIAVYAALRNNSASTTWQIQVNFTGLGVPVSTPLAFIDTSTLNPRIVPLGLISTLGSESLTLSIAASAASGTLDIDYIALVNLRDETVNVLSYDAVALAPLSSGAAQITFDFNPAGNTPATIQGPSALVNGAGASLAMTYRGSLPFITINQNIYVSWLATNGQYWRFTNTSNAALTVQLQCLRYNAFLTPQ